MELTYLEPPEATSSYQALPGAIWRLSAAILNYVELSATICGFLDLSGAIWTNLQKPLKTRNTSPQIHNPNSQTTKHTSQKVGGRRKRR